MRYSRHTVTQVDKETGEERPGTLVLCPPKNPGIGGDFVMARQEGLLKLAADANLGGQDLKVLLVFLACVDFENFVQVEQKWIGDYLGIAKQSVYRSTKKLVEAKILIEGPKVGKHRTYRLSEFYGWKGKSKNYWDRVDNFEGRKVK